MVICLLVETSMSYVQLLLEIFFPVRMLLVIMGTVKYKASRWSALSAL